MRRNCERRPSPVPFSSLTAPKRGNVHKLLKYHNKIGHRKEIAHYLEAVFEDGDPTLVAAALGDVARAKGMSQIARVYWPGEPVQGRTLNNPHPTSRVL